MGEVENKGQAKIQDTSTLEVHIYYKVQVLERYKCFRVVHKNRFFCFYQQRNKSAEYYCEEKDASVYKRGKVMFKSFRR